MSVFKTISDTVKYQMDKGGLQIYYLSIWGIWLHSQTYFEQSVWYTRRNMC